MSLSREQIVEAALVLLREAGLDRLSLRRLAERLDVQAPALYWHFRDKRALLDAMADALVAGTDLGPPRPGEDWQGWLRRRAMDYRRALLHYPDGARLVANARLSAATLVRLNAELDALAACGFSPLKALRTISTMTHYTHGFVLQEQTVRPPSPPEEVAALLQQLPGGPASSLMQAVAADTTAGAEAAFAAGVEAILQGIAQTVSPENVRY